MTTLDDREKSFEARFIHDEELRFKVQNRRNKLLGLWAAQLLKMPPAEAEAYARAILASDFEKPGDEDVHDKVYADLHARGIDLSDHRLRRKMDELMREARRQIMTE